MAEGALFHIPVPNLQIDFSYALAQVRGLYLQDALSTTIEGMDIRAIDKEMARLVPNKALSSLARHGLRGELVFPVPLVLGKNPLLLGYYRLLLGFSQKEFYTSATGASRFKGMEEKGIIPKGCQDDLVVFCKALISSACALIEGIGPERISRGFLDDLTLLTLGPQFRGGANVRKGTAAIVKVFDAIHHIVKKGVTSSDNSRIEIKNAARRKVLIEFAPDPDIIIREEMDNDRYRNIIAIEVKGGTDFSNIHNRIGEAEKSHQKARNKGFTECWTVVNVDRFDARISSKESPSTNRFYRLSDLVQESGDEYVDFKNRIVSLAGIRKR